MLKIMIVDDMDITRREIKRLKLWGEETGFTIAEEAKNGHEALEKLHAGAVDLVITDIKMPKIDGIELLRKIAENNLCPCVVLMSDYSEFDYARQGLVLGAFDYMVKPVDEKELNELLERARAFISVKRMEEDRIKKLEEKLVEKVEVFFPAAEVKKLIQLIEGGDADTSKFASQIADTIEATLDYDPVKVESVLKNILLEIINTILQNNTWFEKFIDVNKLKSTGFARSDEFTSLKAAFVNTIKTITDSFGILQCSGYDGGVISQICKCVLENVDDKISLQAVANTLFMNKTYISEVFKQKTGKAFVEYLTAVKMERAKKLVAEGGHKAYEISDKLGFKDSEYFSKLFKKYTGLTPTEFRNEYSGKD